MGNPFNKNSLRRILQNEKYCGVYTYADIRVEDGIPAIVSRELFDRVQQTVKKHHEKPAAKKIDGGFLLTGKLFCGHCGELMTGDGGTSKTGRVYSYYTCNNRRLKKCDKKRAPKEWIEDLIVQKLTEIANDDDVISAFADHFMAWQEREQKKTEVHGLEDKLKKIEAAIKNTMSVIDSGLISESLKTHLLELEEEKAALEKGITQERIKTPVLERDQVIFFLERFRGGDTEDISWRIFLIETFLKAAYLYDNGDLLLCLNFSGEHNKVTLKLVESAVSDGEELCSNSAPSCPPNGANLNTEKWQIYFFAGYLVAKVCAAEKATRQ